VRLAYTIPEAAQALQVHPETIRRHLANGNLPGRKVGGVWRIPRRGLNDWLNNR
jgi:excisionase family DNA binding protein